MIETITLSQVIKPSVVGSIAREVNTAGARNMPRHWRAGISSRSQSYNLLVWSTRSSATRRYTRNNLRCVGIAHELQNFHMAISCPHFGPKGLCILPSTPHGELRRTASQPTNSNSQPWYDSQGLEQWNSLSYGRVLDQRWSFHVHELHGQSFVR